MAIPLTMTGSPLAIVGVDDRMSPGESVMAVAGRMKAKIQKMKKIAYNPFFTWMAYPDIGHDHNRIYTAEIKKTTDGYSDTCGCVSTADPGICYFFAGTEK